MRTIILTKGLPGSGKTTWAVEEVRKNPGKYIRVNRDLMRKMLLCGEGNRVMEDMITLFRDRMVECSLAKGFDIILDDTNLGDRHFNSMVKAATRVGDVQVIEKYFDVPLMDALANNKKRENPVPEHIIQRMFEKFIKNKRMEAKSYYAPKNEIRVQDTTKPSAYIFDVDGTLALNLGHRGYYDMGKVIDDDPHLDIIEIAIALKEAGHKIIVVSGRDDIALEDTKYWLTGYGILYDDLFMRKTGDTRKDWIIKKEIFNHLIKDHYNVRGVIDDRPQVTRMWRELGITTLQINDIEF